MHKNFNKHCLVTQLKLLLIICTLKKQISTNLKHGPASGLHGGVELSEQLQQSLPRMMTLLVRVAQPLEGTDRHHPVERPRSERQPLTHVA